MAHVRGNENVSLRRRAPTICIFATLSRGVLSHDKAVLLLICTFVREMFSNCAFSFISEIF